MSPKSQCTLLAHTLDPSHRQQIKTYNISKTMPHQEDFHEPQQQGTPTQMHDDGSHFHEQLV